MTSTRSYTMRLFALIALPILLTACGTTSKKLMVLPPLAENAPVEVYYSAPNVKYDKVCEIEASGNNSMGAQYRNKEDFAPMFQREARKCGANAVIFQFLTGYTQGSVKANALGIRIQSQEAGLTDKDQIKAFSIAIQMHDLAKVKEILAKVPRAQKDRAPSDDQLVNLGLYIAAMDGLKCDLKVVQLLENDYGAVVPKFQAVDLTYTNERNDANTPLCHDVMARSLPKMPDVSAAVLAVNNLYVGELNALHPTDTAKRIAAYNKLLKAGASMIVEACKKSGTDSACVVKSGYLDFANKTKLSKTPALKKNAMDVLKILGQ